MTTAIRHQRRRRHVRAERREPAAFGARGEQRDGVDPNLSGPIDLWKDRRTGPREMNIEPSMRFLFVCNLQSNVVTFALDGDSGKMTQAAKFSVPQSTVIDFAVL
jgi:hypothetical protein